jgi:hypothetical protein
MADKKKKSGKGKGEDLKLSKPEIAASDAALDKFWAKENKKKGPAKKKK